MALEIDACLYEPTSDDDRARRRSIAFLNWAHAIDHFVLLIYPTVVIGLEVVYQRSYSELIALSSAAFVAFGVFSLPAGWLADRWSRRNMMAAFYIGCGLSLAGAGFAPNLTALAVAMFALGMFAVDLSSGRNGDADRSIECAGTHARLQWRVRQSRRFAGRRHQRGTCHLVQLARRILCAGRDLRFSPELSITGSRPTICIMQKARNLRRRFRSRRGSRSCCSGSSS